MRGRGGEGRGGDGEGWRGEEGEESLRFCPLYLNFLATPLTASETRGQWGPNSMFCPRAQSELVTPLVTVCLPHTLHSQFIVREL